MSRSLEHYLPALLQQGPDPQAYERITHALSTIQTNGQPRQIEILGKSHQLELGRYILEDSTGIGVSKLGLVQAFFIAREKLRLHLHSPAQTSADDVFSATAVVLLMDPEHLTAANTRKRLLLAHTSRGEMMRRELVLVDSFLTSYLHRHTKSPTLWNHRRWLLAEMKRGAVAPGIDVSGDLSNVVMIAGERHARNYYAWCHARWLVQHALPGARDELALIMGELIGATKAWCFKHHNDISGWTFLGFLLDAVPDERSAVLRTDVATEVIDLARSLRWANESVWVFLRTLVSSQHTDKSVGGRYAEAIAELRSMEPQGSVGQRVLGAALSWQKLHG